MTINQMDVILILLFQASQYIAIIRILEIKDLQLKLSLIIIIWVINFQWSCLFIHHSCIDINILHCRYKLF